jgi:hypothetical protein
MPHFPNLTQAHMENSERIILDYSIESIENPSRPKSCNHVKEDSIILKPNAL